MASKITVNQIKKLRDSTGAGMMEVKKALTEAGGSQAKAKELILKWGVAKADKRSDKEANEGQIYSYVHPGGRVGALVKVACETDFVANSSDFQTLCKELSLQVASMNPKDVKDLLAQSYIRDPKKKIDDLVKETAAKVKEKIEVSQIVRLSL
jgi:elongation factor Ts